MMKKPVRLRIAGLYFNFNESRNQKAPLWIFFGSSGIHLLSLFVRVSHQQHGVAFFDTNVVLEIILQRFTVREEKRKDKIPQDEFEFDARCSMLHSDECFRRALKKHQQQTSHASAGFTHFQGNITKTPRGGKVKDTKKKRENQSGVCFR